MSKDNHPSTPTGSDADLPPSPAQLQAALAATQARLEQETAHRQRLEAALRETQNELITQQNLAALGAMTAGIAHEMRNPLNFVLNFAELSIELMQELQAVLNQHRDRFEASALEDIDDIFFALDQNVQKVNEHGRRAERIVSAMLEHTRGQTGSREPTDLNAMLGEYINLVYHSFRAQNASFTMTLETDYDPSIGLVEVVPQDIGRVFLNVLNNACYAAHAKSKVLGNPLFTPLLSVRTAKLADGVEIRIRDNGNGMLPDVQAQMFQPFYTTKPAGSGTGLGLSISHDIIVQQHRGTIRAESEPGVYTEIVLTLPTSPSVEADGSHS
jgi:signal transduction histidine kinase